MDTDEETIDPTEVHLTKKCAFATGWETPFAHHYPCESVFIRGSPLSARNLNPNRNPNPHPPSQGGGRSLTTDEHRCPRMPKQDRRLACPAGARRPCLRGFLLKKSCLCDDRREARPAASPNPQCPSVCIRVHPWFQSNRWLSQRCRRSAPVLGRSNEGTPEGKGLHQ